MIVSAAGLCVCQAGASSNVVIVVIVNVVVVVINVVANVVVWFTPTQTRDSGGNITVISVQ